MIFNLTQHEPTPDQISAGVAPRPKQVTELVKDLLTFDEMPTDKEIKKNRIVGNGSKSLF